VAGKSTIQWHLNLHMSSEWLIKGGSERDLADTHVLSDLLGYPYIPASTIKGQLRYQHRRLASLYPQLQEWETFFFGEKGFRHGHLYITDARLKDSLPSEQLLLYRSRVAIDRKRRVSRDQALLTEEVVIPGINLYSELMCHVPPMYVGHAVAALTLCILNIRYLGSGKSIGRGHLRVRYKGTELSTDDSTVEVSVDNQPWTYDELVQEIHSLTQQENQ